MLLLILLKTGYRFRWFKMTLTDGSKLTLDRFKMNHNNRFKMNHKYINTFNKRKEKSGYAVKKAAPHLFFK